MESKATLPGIAVMTLLIVTLFAGNVTSLSVSDPRIYMNRISTASSKLFRPQPAASGATTPSPTRKNTVGEEPNSQERGAFFLTQPNWFFPKADLTENDVTQDNNELLPYGVDDLAQFTQENPERYYKRMAWMPPQRYQIRPAAHRVAVNEEQDDTPSGYNFFRMMG